MRFFLKKEVHKESLISPSNKHIHDALQDAPERQFFLFFLFLF